MSDGRRELDRRSFIAGGAASGLALGMGRAVLLRKWLKARGRRRVGLVDRM